MAERRRRLSPWAWLAVGLGGLVVLGAGLIAALSLGLSLYVRSRAPGRHDGAVSVPRASAGPLRPQWRYLPGMASGLACGDVDEDRQPEVLVRASLSSGPAVAVLDAHGKLKRTFAVSPTTETLEVGRRSGSALVIGFDAWGTVVEAYDGLGQALWRYDGGKEGIECAAPVDVSSRVGDAVAIGCDGRGGLHLVAPDGKRVWASTGLGSVWSVSAAHLSRGRGESIICAHAGGNVLVYDALGKRRGEMRPGIYVHVVYGADVDGDGVDEVLAAGPGLGSAGGEELSVLDAKGSERWRYAVGSAGKPGARLIAVGSFVRGQRHVVVASAGGELAVLDDRGNRVGGQQVGAAVRGLAILPGTPDRLLVLTPRGCICYGWRAAEALQPS